MNIELMVVTDVDPEANSILSMERDVPTPIFAGEGDVNLLCGECGFAVAEGLHGAGQVQQMILRCPRCQAYNRTRT